MRDDHPSLETLARWLSGELEHEQVVQELAPHFLGSCPVCQERQEEIWRLQEESGHWDAVVAVLETREAPELVKLLEGKPYEEQMQIVTRTEDLHTWGVCQLLLKESREAVFSDPAGAVEKAYLAVRVSVFLGEAYHPGWVLDLRALAYAHLGNAQRVLGELKAADQAFLRAEECLERSGLGGGQTPAEVLSLKGSLRLDQRRLAEALKLVDRAADFYTECQNQQGIAKALLQKAKILNEMGAVEQAIELLQGGAIDPAQEPQLFAQARYNLLGFLVLANRHEEAAQLLPEVRDLYRDTAGLLDWLRLRWAEAHIAQGLGRPEDAEAAYREIQREFLNLQKSYDAALVSLDLAALLAEQGRTAELKELATEIRMVFEAQEVHREALASLLLFQRACEKEEVTLELIRQLSSRFEKERWGRGEV